MSSAATPARSAGGSGPTNPNRRESEQSDWKWTVLKSLLLYFLIQGITSPNGLIAWYQGKTQFQQQQQQQNNAAITQNIPKELNRNLLQTTESLLAPGTNSINIYNSSTLLDFYIIISTSEAPTKEIIATQFSPLTFEGREANFEKVIEIQDDLINLIDSQEMKNGIKIWQNQENFRKEILTGIKLNSLSINDFSNQFDIDLNLSIPEKVHSENGSIWADIFIQQNEIKSLKGSVRIRKLLTRLYPERKERKEKKLFERNKENDVDDDQKRIQEGEKKGNKILSFLEKDSTTKIISYWHNNLTLALIDQEGNVSIPIASLPSPLLKYVYIKNDLKIEKEQEQEEEQQQQQQEEIKDSNLILNYPILFPNDFWHLRQHMNKINSTNSNLPLHISIYKISFFKFQLLAAMSDSFEKQSINGGIGSGEIDMIKLTLLENSPWYLGLTFIISILHSLFEFLAFSSDVSHWKNKKNMIGVSLGSILTNVFVQLIILLYLFDQSQETSWMILGSQGIGIVIEIWKITKAVSIKIKPRQKGEGLKFLQWLPFKIEIKDKHILTKEEIKTKEFDKLAFKIVSLIAIPLLFGFTIYSAIYQSHKSLWSFIIGTLCSFVYAFGFVSLIPQLIVNYKLKSVAGMNSKTFIFKILGTIVDDFFAFAIRQPFLHKIACFRDDLVFLIFLFQRWKYGIDPTRVNEFGQVLEEKKEGEGGELKEELKGRESINEKESILENKKNQ